MTNKKCHPTTSQKNDLGHVGCVQNEQMTFSLAVQNGVFKTNFPSQMNYEF